MTSEAAHVDVAVVGGGVIGLAIAWQTAQRGMSVTVVDDARVARASWAAAGMLAPASEVSYGEEALLALSLRSAQQFPQFVAELEEASGLTTDYRKCGSLLVSMDNDDHAVLSELFDFQRRLGLQSERINRRAARALEPSLHPGIRSALLVEGDHQIDNRRLLEALHEASRRSGVTIERDTASLVVEAGRVIGVRLNSGGSLTAENVVVAGGCWSASVDGLPVEARPAVRPVKGQILRLRCDPSSPLINRTVRALVHGSRVYLVPRASGEIVVGATMEERGFDASVTAGAVHDLLRDAREVVPEIAECELIESWVGLRPGSPGNSPTIGPTTIDGLVMATGHHRNGILLTPVTASGVAELLCTGALPAELLPFAPGSTARAMGEVVR